MGTCSAMWRLGIVPRRRAQARIFLVIYGLDCLTWRRRAALLPKIPGSRAAEFRIIPSEPPRRRAARTFAALKLATTQCGDSTSTVERFRWRKPRFKNAGIVSFIASRSGFITRESREHHVGTDRKNRIVH